MRYFKHKKWFLGTDTSKNMTFLTLFFFSTAHFWPFFRVLWRHHTLVTRQGHHASEGWRMNEKNEGFIQLFWPFFNFLPEYIAGWRSFSLSEYSIGRIGKYRPAFLEDFLAFFRRWAATKASWPSCCNFLTAEIGMTIYGAQCRCIDWITLGLLIRNPIDLFITWFHEFPISEMHKMK